ncbi:hypothetical protein Tco_1111104 [Tanacetum coccineum]|uniref:Uncharacterized protein n=1 Tax=Tanacetum coccineum TaxID=301880 RepID=A0ABQ5IL54_9ASTR
METKDTISSCSISKEQQMQQIQDTTKESCMVSFRRLHSYLKLLSNNDLKGTRTESGFKHAFATLFGQDVDTFASTMFLNVDNLEKQLDNDEFQEIGSMASFKVLVNRIPEFRDTLMQHMESVKKSIDERALHKREYDTRVNERQMQIIEGKVDTCKALDASLVDIECSGNRSKEEATKRRSGNVHMLCECKYQTIYDEEQWLRYQRLLKSMVFCVTGQHILAAPEFNNEGEISKNSDGNKPNLGGVLQERYSTLAQTRLTVNPQMVQMRISLTIPYGIENNSDVSADTLNLSAGTSFNPKKEGLRVCSELGIHNHNNEPSSSKLVPKVVPLAEKTATSQQELELLFSPMYEEYFNAGNPSVSKSSALFDNFQQHET